MKKLLMIAVLMLLTAIGGQAQPAGYQDLMDEARSYSQQKEYEKSSECYEKAIAMLKGTEMESLIPSVRDLIAINHLHLGVAALKAKDYPKAKAFLEKAIDDAKPNSKTYYMAHSWMGQWHSVQSLNIRTTRGDYEEALRLSLEAEKCFNQAQAPDKRLREQLSRASILKELLRYEEAVALLKQIITECGTVESRRIIMGKAHFSLGSIEVEEEQYQQALQHLEQAYELCLALTTQDAKSYAYLAAGKLYAVYTQHIPDSEKAALWQQRADQLEDQVLR